jgi:hypothetical protein
LPAAFLANIFGYVNFGNLLGIVFLRSVYVAAMLYAAIRINEGFVVIAMQVRPLGSLRVISLHRPMLQRRTCRILEFLAFLFWLNLLLNFFGLRTQLIATTEAAQNANLAIGSFNITLAHPELPRLGGFRSVEISAIAFVEHHLKNARPAPAGLPEEPAPAPLRKILVHKKPGGIWGKGGRLIKKQK